MPYPNDRNSVRIVLPDHLDIPTSLYSINVNPVSLYAHLCVKHCVGQKNITEDLCLREFLIVLEDHDLPGQQRTMQDTIELKYDGVY